MKTITISQIPKIKHIRYILLFTIILMSTNAMGQNVYSVLFEEWVNSNWQKQVQTINTYDGSNHLTHSISYNWMMPPGTWQNASQTDYANNPDGTLNQSVTQIWDTGSSSWYDFLRSTYTYTASKKVLTVINEMNLGVWSNSTKETNTYDGSGYLTNNLQQNWDSGSNNWKNNRQTNYTNNASGYATQSIEQSWNASNMWVNQERATYTYTGANKVHTATNEIWTGINWFNERKLTNTYNAGGYVTVALSQEWYTTSNTWVNTIQSLYSYNGSNSITQIISQNWDIGTSTWTNGGRVTFGYNLGTDDFTANSKLMLYPNPSLDVVTIKSSTPLFDADYFITDQTGRTIKTGQLNDEETTIDISQMSRGLYFFRIDQNYKSAIKLIKN